VLVQTTPAGAALFVDGKRRGLTPQTLKGIDFAKPHKVELKKFGFQDAARDVSAADAWEAKADHQELTVSVELAKVAGAPDAKATTPAPVRKAKKAGGAGKGGGDAVPGDEKAAGADDAPTESASAASGKPAREPKEKEPEPAAKPTGEDKPDLKTPDWMKK
jgi:hypothetical protein